MTQHIVTVATESHVDGIIGLVASLRESGYEDQITIFCPEDEEWDPHLEGVSMKLLPAWYKRAWPREQMSRDARFLKPCILDHYEEGDRVLFFDGGDYLVYGDVQELFDEVEEADILLDKAPPEKQIKTIPGFSDLTGVEESERDYFWDGIWAVRVCGATCRFFELWKAYCMWSFPHSDGDMTPFNLALTDLSGGSFGPDVHVMDHRWQHLPEDGPVKLEEVKGVHGTGTRHEVYDRCYEELVGHPPRQMILDGSGHWQPEGTAPEQVVPEKLATREPETDPVEFNFCRRWGSARELGILPMQSMDEMHQLLKVLPADAERVVELGSAGGGWLYMLAGLLTPPAHFIAVDHAFQDNFELTLQLLEEESFVVDRVEGETRDCVDLVENLLRGPIDILHIDAAHGQYGPSSDWKLFSPLLGDQSFVVLHDVDHPDFYEPGQVFETIREGRESWMLQDNMSGKQMGIGVVCFEGKKEHRWESAGRQEVTANEQSDPGPLDRPALLQLHGLSGLTGVEVGVEKGLNALRILCQLDIEKLYLVDPYEEAVGAGPGRPESREKALQNRAEAERRLDGANCRTEWVHGTTDDLELQEELDFAYIDGDHSRGAVRKDLENLWPWLRSGGLMAGHDYQGVPTCPVLEDSGVKHAVDRFFDALGLRVHHRVDRCGLGEREDWWVWKP